MSSKRTRGNEGASSSRAKGKGKKKIVEEPYDSDRFTNAKAQKWFETDTKTAIPERGIDLASFDPRQNDLGHCFMIRRWTKVAKTPSSACIELVREFYANAYYCDENFDCLVRGKIVNWSAESINQLLGLPEVEDETWTDVDILRADEMLATLCVPGAQWYSRSYSAYNILQKDMNLKTKAVHKFICANINPTGHVSDASYDRVVLNFCIQRPEIKINYGLHVHRAILRVLQSREDAQTAQLVCPYLITRLLMQQGVAITEAMRMFKPAPMIRMSKNFGLVRQGPLAQPAAENVENEEEEGARREGLIDEELCYRLDGLEESNSSMLHDMGDLRRSQTAMGLQVNELEISQNVMMQRQDNMNWMMERFAGHFSIDISDRPPWPQYPPPPPPQDDMS